MLVGRTNACVAPMKTEPKGSKWLQIPSLFCIPAPWTIQLQLVSGCKWYLADIAPNWDIVHQLHTTTNHLRIWQHDATWFCLTTGLILDHNFPLSTSSHFRQRFRVYVSFSNTPFPPKKSLQSSDHFEELYWIRKSQELGWALLGNGYSFGSVRRRSPLRWLHCSLEWRGNGVRCIQSPQGYMFDHIRMRTNRGIMQHEKHKYWYLYIYIYIYLFI